MSRIYENLGSMTNTELNSLAKNYWTDDNIQSWIARHGNIQARYYLAENPGICDDAASALMCGRSLKVKAMLVGSGKLKSQETIREVFKSVWDRYGASWGYWKYWQNFVNNPWEYRKTEGTNTPSDVLMEIFNMYWAKDTDKDPLRYAYSTRFSVQLFQRIANHKNCPVEMGIILSTSSDPEIIKVGRDILVKSKKEKNASI